MIIYTNIEELPKIFSQEKSKLDIRILPPVDDIKEGKLNVDHTKKSVFIIGITNHPQTLFYSGMIAGMVYKLNPDNSHYICYNPEGVFIPWAEINCTSLESLKKVFYLIETSKSFKK